MSEFIDEIEAAIREDMAVRLRRAIDKVRANPLPDRMMMRMPSGRWLDLPDDAGELTAEELEWLKMAIDPKVAPRGEGFGGM